MRKILIFLIGMMLVCGCKSKTPRSKRERVKVVKIDISAVDISQKTKAYELGKRILITCNTSKFKPFTTSEATPAVIKNTTQQRLTKTCLAFRLKYGDFKDLNLIEVLRNKKDKATIYRYKAIYEKKIAEKELRVTMNDNNQVAAIKSKDWSNKFQ